MHGTYCLLHLVVQLFMSSVSSRKGIRGTCRDQSKIPSIPFQSHIFACVQMLADVSVRERRASVRA